MAAADNATINPQRRLLGKAMAAGVLGLAAVAAPPAHAAAPLRVGYSDWPGWVAWQVAIEKDWLKQAGVPVEFVWFDYSASIDAYAAGKLDAVLVTNGDGLVLGASGAHSVFIMPTDYSSGNDMIIARPGLRSVGDLKGKKVAVEIGLVEHLLLLNALKKHGMSDSDVQLINAKTNEMPQMLASGDVAAIGAWQPVCGQTIKAVPGARPIYTSADEPGLIYDVLAVRPTSVSARRTDWLKLVSVWNRVVHFISDPQTQPEALRIMSARVGLTPEAYLPLLRGTRLLTLDEGRKVFERRPALDSIFGSSQSADGFNVRSGVYHTAQNVGSYIDASLLNVAR